MALDCALRTVDTHCEITLLTVVQQPDVPIYGTNPMVMVPREYPSLDVIREDARHYLESVAETLRAQGYNVHVRVELGEPAQEIAKVARAIAADMIVISTHGRSGISRWLFGSVTAKVLSGAPCPVLVVPNQPTQNRAEGVAAQVNFG